MCAAAVNRLAIDGGVPVRRSPMGVLALVGEGERRRVLEVLETGVLSEFRAGPQARAFEDAFAGRHDCRYGVAVTSGTVALHLALCAIGVQPGDEVIVPALSFVATASAVLQCGARPIVADVLPDSFCLAPGAAEQQLTDQTKAILPVHLFGHPAPLESVAAISARSGAALVEDCAQAHGASLDGRKVGSWGQLGCFSFFQSKNMTCGEGGMVITSDHDLRDRLRLLKEHGNPRSAGADWYQHVILGFNFQMAEVPAAIGLAQLERLDAMNERRRQIVRLYQRQLVDTCLEIPWEASNIEHAHHLFPVLLPRRLAGFRDWSVEALERENVVVGVNYPRTLGEDPVFWPHLDGPVTDHDGAARRAMANVPVAFDVSRRIVTLHTDPCLSDRDILDVCEAFHKVLDALERGTSGSARAMSRAMGC
jgi:perosamine synthetase